MAFFPDHFLSANVSQVYGYECQQDECIRGTLHDLNRCSEENTYKAVGIRKCILNKKNTFLTKLLQWEESNLAGTLFIAHYADCDHLQRNCIDFNGRQ